MSGSSEPPRLLPPGPRGNFLLGNTLPYIRDQLGFAVRGLLNQYGDMVRLLWAI